MSAFACIFACLGNSIKTGARTQYWLAIYLLLQGLPSLAEQQCQLDTIEQQTPTTDFIVHGDGTVTHIQTGLMWKQCVEGLEQALCDSGEVLQFNWLEALQAAEQTNLGGGYASFGDWRVPTIAELATIVELQCFRPAINLTVFPNTPEQFFWTSSPNALNDDSSWIVGFIDGSTGNQTRTDSYPLRLVRSGR